MVNGLAFNGFIDPDSSESFQTIATLTGLHIFTHRGNSGLPMDVW